MAEMFDMFVRYEFQYVLAKKQILGSQLHLIPETLLLLSILRQIFQVFLLFFEEILFSFDHSQKKSEYTAWKFSMRLRVTQPRQNTRL